MDGDVITLMRAGRSPRTRGRLAEQGVLVDWRRSIPAYAGETPSSRWKLPSARVDPRVRGGDLAERQHRLDL